MIYSHRWHPCNGWTATKVKGLYSEKTGKTYDATVLLADTGGKYVNYRVERKE